MVDLESLRDFHIQYFSSQVALHGDDVASVGWTKHSQRKRFRKLLEIGDLASGSVLDIGCGQGGLYDFLVEACGAVDYWGFDITPGMIELARRRHPSIADRFQVHDILAKPVHRQFDYVVSIGPMNVPVPEGNVEPTMLLVRAMFEHCTNGIAISMTSSLTRRPSVGTYYYNPTTILERASEITPNVCLDHTYLPHDLMLFCYKADLYDSSVQALSLPG
jgi:SAM-dependent methyltransferase